MLQLDLDLKVGSCSPGAAAFLSPFLRFRFFRQLGRLRLEEEVEYAIEPAMRRNKLELLLRFWMRGSPHGTHRVRETHVITPRLKVPLLLGLHGAVRGPTECSAAQTTPSQVTDTESGEE
ncbi:uncharacterized [Tachysurus ichikawai]